MTRWQAGVDFNAATSIVLVSYTLIRECTTTKNLSAEDGEHDSQPLQAAGLSRTARYPTGSSSKMLVPLLRSTKQTPDVLR